MPACHTRHADAPCRKRRSQGHSPGPRCSSGHLSIRSEPAPPAGGRDGDRRARSKQQSDREGLLLARPRVSPHARGTTQALVTRSALRIRQLDEILKVDGTAATARNISTLLIGSDVPGASHSPLTSQGAEPLKAARAPLPGTPHARARASRGTNPVCSLAERPRRPAGSQVLLTVRKHHGGGVVEVRPAAAPLHAARAAPLGGVPGMLLAPLSLTFRATGKDVAHAHARDRGPAAALRALHLAAGAPRRGQGPAGGAQAGR